MNRRLLPTLGRVAVTAATVAAVVLAALVWAGINTFATNKVGELG